MPFPAQLDKRLLAMATHTTLPAFPVHCLAACGLFFGNLLSAGSAVAQKPMNVVTDETLDQAEELIRARFSPEAVEDATSLSEEAVVTQWSYRDSRGNVRSTFQAYRHLEIHNNEPWVVFESRERAPLRNFLDEEQHRVQRLGQLAARVARHHEKMVAEIRDEEARRAQEEARRAREEDAQRLALIEANTMPQIAAIHEFLVETPTQRPITVGFNERFEVLETSEERYRISLAGGDVWVPKDNFRVIGRVSRRPNEGKQIAWRPVINDPPAPRPEPPRLDLYMEFTEGFLGGVVTDVFQGGWAAGVGIIPGDRIIRINDRPIRTADEARVALRLGNGTAHLLVERQGQIAVFQATVGGGIPLGISVAARLVDGTVEIRGMIPNSAAERLGLRVGDLVLSVNGLAIQAPENLYHFDRQPQPQYQIEFVRPPYRNLRVVQGG